MTVKVIEKIWREQMARETWKCPYAHCQQECGRNWNVCRHIARKHSGIGVPVKNKSSVHERPLIEMSSKETKLLPFDGGKPTTSKYGEENDIVDSIYKTFKKIRGRYDKIIEIKNFYKPSNSTIFPLPPIVPNASPLPFEITDTSKQATESNVSEINVNNSNISAEFDPPVGFRTHICADCLTGPVDPVRLSELNRLGLIAFHPNHTCKQADLQRRRAIVKQQYDFITKWNELRILSIRYLAYIVHQWVGLHKDIYIKAIEETNLKSQILNSLPINLGKIDKNHWAYRALNDNEEKKRTVIDDTQLMNFLNLAKATFAPFRAEIDGKEHYFYLYIFTSSTLVREKETMFT